MASSERQPLVPQAFQLTQEQVDWLDARARRNQTFSRSAEIRAIVQAAIEEERSKEEAMVA